MARALRGARRNVDIATPFLSRPVAGLLVRESYNARRRRILTAVNGPAVSGGYLDPLGVEIFIEAGFEARSLRNLHAKVVLADTSWGLVGSGNLTVAGSNGANAELGVVLTSAQVRRARGYFEEWWSAAEPVDLSYLRRLARARRPKAPERQQREGRGGVWRGDPGQELEAFLHDRRGSGVWLKIMHHRGYRDDPAAWLSDTWISDVHRRSADGRPLLRPSYKVGERLVIYLSSPAQRCVAVVRVTRPAEFEPERVRREGFRGDDERWGWVTEVTGERAIAVAHAPTLDQLGIPSASVMRNSHIRLTPDQYARALRHIPAPD
jgi:hypothetical protein